MNGEIDSFSTVWVESLSNAEIAKSGFRQWLNLGNTSVQPFKILKVRTKAVKVNPCQ
jgi:hypothetical protein